jgi:hypothetical protein
MNAQVDILLKYPKELDAPEAQVTPLVLQAENFVIQNDDDLAVAASNLKAVKAEATRAENERKAMTRPLDESKRNILLHFSPWEKGLEAAEAAWKRCISKYQAKQLLLRQEAERRAAEASRKERERMEAEAAKRDEEARREREKSDAKARELEEQGKTERAEALRAKSEEKATAKQADADALRMAANSMPTAPVVVMPAAKIEGISSREVWGAELIDKMVLIRAVAAGEAPADLLEVNMPLANKLARALKAGFKFAGLRAVTTTSVAVRA